MSWRYRAGRARHNGQWWYTIREYFTEIEEMPGGGYTGPITPGGETKKDLIEDLEMMLEDLRRFNAFTDKIDY